MTNIPDGISIAETDEGFILYRKDLDGSVASFGFSYAEAHGLKAQLDLWTSRVVSLAQAKSGSLQAVVSHQVADADIAMDALQADILLSLKTPTGEVMSFRLPKDASQYIAERIVEMLPTFPDVPEDFQ